MNIVINDFVKRQTKDSRFSHFAGEEGMLVQMVAENFNERRAGYRDGVALVSVPPTWFYSGVAALEPGDVLTGGFESRRHGEEPRKFVVATGKEKLQARRVDVVLYASTVLAEEGTNQLPAESGNWEIISINASPVDADMPIDPIVLMHNHFESDGGTTTGLSDEDFVHILRESFLFWKDKAMCGGQ